jgi:cell division septation protein DedD
MAIRTVSAAMAMSLVTVFLMAGCSRERQDWRSAEAADTSESYDHFIARHPDGPLAAQARARLAQLAEDHDWQRATTVDTAAAYRQFLAQHASGKFSEEARIRIENFSLEAPSSTPGTGPAGGSEANPSPGTASPPPEPRSTLQTPSTAQIPEHSVTAPAAVSRAPASGPPPGAAPTPTPTPTSSSTARIGTQGRPISDGFGVQLGAFSSEAAARGEWQQLQARFRPQLAGLVSHTVPGAAASGRIYRLQVATADEARARALCESLLRQSQPCVVVLPASN